MENKRSAVEWLESFLLPEISNDPANRGRYRELFNRAKVMEKEQMIDFARGFWYWGNGSDAPPVYPEDVEKYYNKTYTK